MASIKPNEYAQSLGITALPRHVGAIMDGNGRWAKRRGMPRGLGHRAGANTTKEIVRMSSDLGIEAFSVYAFSTENWVRPQEEVGILMKLIIEFIYKEIDEMNKNGVRMRFMGDIDSMAPEVKRAVEYGITQTAANKGIVFNIALNYGGRAEVARAARLLAMAVARGELPAEGIDEDALAAHMYTAGLPDPDLIIRTSGELRMSNFMLWQASYAELAFPQVCWPDFTREEYAKVLKDYAARQRRFGAVVE